MTVAEIAEMEYEDRNRRQRIMNIKRLRVQIKKLEREHDREIKKVKSFIYVFAFLL